MTWLHTDRSRKDYRAAPPEVQKAFDNAYIILAIIPHPK